MGEVADRPPMGGNRKRSGERLLLSRRDRTTPAAHPQTSVSAALPNGAAGPPQTARLDATAAERVTTRCQSPAPPQAQSGAGVRPLRTDGTPPARYRLRRPRGPSRRARRTQIPICRGWDATGDVLATFGDSKVGRASADRPAEQRLHDPLCSRFASILSTKHLYCPPGRSTGGRCLPKQGISQEGER